VIKVAKTLLAVLIATMMTASPVNAQSDRFKPMINLKIKPTKSANGASADPAASMKASLKKIRDATLRDSRAAAAASAGRRLSDPRAKARAIEKNTKATEAQRQAARDKFQRANDAARWKACTNVGLPANKC
jgi:hypothetical protein